MSPKEEILSAVRRSIGARPDREADYAAIPRKYRQEGSLDRAAGLEMLVDRLQDYEAGVYRCGAADLAAAIAHAAAERGKTRLLVPGGVPREWLPESVEFVDGDAADYAALDACQGALTGCAAAIAMTGSIFLTHTSLDGRRALTLLPDYHLCVVFAEQVVETVPEAIRRVRNAGLITTISGPSATADIEMMRVKGVHGPRTLDVILVE